jgi:hypothetical protein
LNSPLPLKKSAQISAILTKNLFSVFLNGSRPPKSKDGKRLITKMDCGSAMRLRTPQ